MDDLEKLKLNVEMWKQTVDVQKHFNDIELRVRGLALTALTFAVGAAALAIKDKSEVSLNGHHVQLATLILALGAAIWLAFYFVDQVWYHRLLLGAVKHGEALELEIAKTLPLAGLTKQISQSSPYPVNFRLFRWRRTWEIHSSTKMKLFYWSISACLVGLAIGAEVGAP